MQNRAGAIISVTTCLVLLAVLAWPYAIRSTYDINTYYGSGVVNLLLAGVLTIGVLVVFAAIRTKYVSAELGAGISLGLGLISFFIVVMWAVTARIDVFRAPGWVLPAQRFVLVGLAGLIVAGTGWYTWANDLLSLRR